MTARTAVTVIFTLNGLAIGTWGGRIPAIKDHVDVGPGGLALPLACLAAGALIAMPVSGRLTRRFGSAPIAAIGVGALGLALPLPAVVPGLGLVALAALFFGAANGLLDVAMNAQGVAVERRLTRPILSGLHAGFSLGALAGAGVGAVMAQSGVGAATQFLAVGLLILVVGQVCARHLAEDRVDATAPSGAPGDADVLVSGSRRLWRLRVLAGCALFAEGAATDWSALHLRDLGAGAGVAALAFAGFSLAMGSGRLAGDALTRRWGAEALARRGGLVATAALALALLAGAPGVALPAYIALGFGLAVVVPLVFRAAAQGGPSAGPALASVTSTGYLGFLFGPPLIGLLAEATSVPTALVLVVAATAAIVAGAGVLRTGAVA
jgi:MFS family permease